MKILRLSASGFGTFTGEVCFDPGKLNLVIGVNESGKTTMASAVTAALYGLDADGRRHRARLTPHEQYDPWGGRAYALEMCFVHLGKRYTVNRHFTRGTVTVFEEGRGNVTEEFRLGSGEYRIGEEMLSLNLDQFARSALWLQEGPARLAGEDVRPDGSVAMLLESQASSVSGDASAQAALEVLEAALQQYQVGEKRLTVKNQIKTLEARIETQSTLLREETVRQERAALALGQLSQVRAEETELAGAERRAAYQALRAALEDVGEQLKRDDEGRRQFGGLREELERLRSIPSLPPDAATRLSRAQADRRVAERRLEELASRRRALIDEPRQDVRTGMESARAYAWAAPVHLEEISSLERDIARVRLALDQARAKRIEVEEDLRRAGIEVERWEALSARYGGLSPGDSNLLTNAPATTQAWATERDKADRSVSESSERLAAIAAERNARRWGGLASVALGIGAGAGSVAFAVNGQVGLSFAGLAVTLLSLAAGILLVLSAAGHRAAERVTVLRAFTEGRRRLQTLKEQATERQLALEELCRRLGFASPETLLREHSEYLKVVREGDRLAWVREDLERHEKEQESLARRAWEWAGRARGEKATSPDIPEGWEPTAALAEIRAAVEGVLVLRGRAEVVDREERDLSEQEASARQVFDQAIAEAIEVARELGTPEDDWERALVEIEERRRAMERRQHLEETLARLQGSVWSEEERAGCEAEAESLRADVERLAAGKPEWGVEPLPASLTRAEIEAGRREIQHKLEVTRNRRLELERQVGWLESSRDGKTSAIRLEISELEHELARARRFQRAVALASERLRAVARETNARWSEFLSRRVNELLPVLGPAYRGFEVTDDLDYSVVLEGHRLDRERLDQVLSAGARDQLRLALRVAVCEFLSRGPEKLPLVLDDPFATSDDERAEAGLRYLAETVAPEHQVILLTCHRARVNELKRKNPSWFSARVSCVDMPAGEPLEATGGEPGRRGEAEDLFG